MDVEHSCTGVEEVLRSLDLLAPGNGDIGVSRQPLWSLRYHVDDQRLHVLCIHRVIGVIRGRLPFICVVKSKVNSPSLPLVQILGLVKSKPLYSGDAFVLQNTHHYATILRLSLLRLVFADLVGLSHGTWG